MLTRFAILTTAFLSLAGFAKAQYITLQEVFPQNRYGAPVEFQMVPGHDSLVATVSQAGVIKVFDLARPAAAPKTMLDISGTHTQRSGEMGLLGFAFHPLYPRVNKIYVNYTNNRATNPPPLATVVASFNVDTALLKADTGSRKVVITFSQPFQNHNGGKVAFGPDGKLYIATGDGGSAGDPQNNAQRKNTMLGKILRLDVDSLAPNQGYRIPRDNPFVDSGAGVNKEIYAFGLRNPWRFSFDFPTRRLWLGDVGQGFYEEIDTIVAGGNYGWKLREGYNCYGNPATCNRPGLLDPIWQYTHANGNISITGGYVYRGSEIPFLYGTYVYADYGSGRIWGLSFGGDTLMINTLLKSSGYNISHFGVGPGGELYAANIATAAYYKLKLDPTAVRPAFTASSMRVYPQPARERLTVELNLPTSSPTTVQLLTPAGQIVRSIAYEQLLTVGEHRFVVQTQGLPASTYILKATTETGSIARRITVVE